MIKRLLMLLTLATACAYGGGEPPALPPPSFRVAMHGTRFMASPSPAPPNPVGINQVSKAIFDSVNNAIRINAGVGSAAPFIPFDANQVFTSIFDSGNTAVRVNCVAGCAGGSVTSFSAGNLSPLFTTSVATATSTPALSFTLSNAGAFTLFANNTNASAAPSYTTMDSIFGSCSAATSALTYNTTTHAFGCNTVTTGTVTSIATAAPITGGTITSTGTIACPTCAIGPGSSITNHLAKFSGTDGITLADGGTIPTGTVTSIATTGPITGGTITATGTIACATCATTTNGGAISGTAPVAVSAAGAISVTGAVGQVLAGSGPVFTATPSLGTDNSAAGTLQLANGSSNAHTIWGSAATTSNTINGFATAPTTGHIVDCTVVSTTCTLHDSGVVTANVVNASSPGAGVAHFAGSTQTVTSSAVVAADTDTSIAHTGVDVNTSYQVTATHLTAALPVNQGGTGSTTGVPQVTGGNCLAIAAPAFCPWNGGSPNATGVNVNAPMAATGTITDLYVIVPTNFGASTGVTYTVASCTPADTGTQCTPSDKTITCTINGSSGAGSLECSDSAHTVSITKGDVVTVHEAIQQGTPTSKAAFISLRILSQ